MSDLQRIAIGNCNFRSEYRVALAYEYEDDIETLTNFRFTDGKCLADYLPQSNSH